MELSYILNPEPDAQSPPRRVELPQILNLEPDVPSSPRRAPTEMAHSRVPATLAEELRFIATLRYHGQNLTWRQITDCYSDRFGKPTLGQYVLRDRLRVIDRPGWSLENILKNDNGVVAQKYRSEMDGILQKYGSGIPSWSPRAIKQKPTPEEMRFVTALRFCSRYKQPSWDWITTCYVKRFKKPTSSSNLLHDWYTHRGKDDGFYKHVTDSGGEIPPRFEDEIRAVLLGYDGEQPPPKAVVLPQPDTQAYESTRTSVDESPAPDEPATYKEMFSRQGNVNRFITILRSCVRDMNWNGLAQCFGHEFAAQLEKCTPGRRPSVATLRQSWTENREKHGSFYHDLTEHNSIRPEYEKEVGDILAKYGKNPGKIMKPEILGQPLRGL
ncbi:MAG: hypothetical protein M1812_006895 [Candelaria pacifica]|nr:MAG: hypothetical protein M1812_006895 [Candelaria pacifica]